MTFISNYYYSNIYIYILFNIIKQLYIWYNNKQQQWFNVKGYPKNMPNMFTSNWGFVWRSTVDPRPLIIGIIIIVVAFLSIVIFIVTIIFRRVRGATYTPKGYYDYCCTKLLVLLVLLLFNLLLLWLGRAMDEFSAKIYEWWL